MTLGDSEGGRTTDPSVKSAMYHCHTAGPPTLSRPLGFCKSQSLGGWQMQLFPKRDQIDHVSSHGQNKGGLS